MASEDDLKSRVLEVVEELNRSGRCATAKAVWGVISRERGVMDRSEAKKLYDRIAKALMELSAAQRLVRRKEGSRGSRAYYAIPEYAQLLDACDPHGMVSIEHIRSDVAKGLEVLGTFNPFEPMPSLPRRLSAEERVAVETALAHVLRGPRFAKLRELLDRAASGEDTIAEFQYEALLEARRLKYVMGPEGARSDIVGTCHVCGPPLTEEEKKRVEGWLGRLLRSLTGGAVIH